MLKWVSGLLGGLAVDVPEGVPRPWVERLQQRLKPLSKEKQSNGGDLADDTLAFVLHGEPLSALGALGSSSEAGNALGLTAFITDEKFTAQLYEHFESVPIAIALRWAKVLEAAAVQQRPHYHLAFERDVHWPELLLVHSSGESLNSYRSPRPKAQSQTAARLDAMCVEDGLSPAAWLLAGFVAPGGSGYFNDQRFLLVTDVAGYDQALLRHATAIAPLLLPASVSGRVHALKMAAPAPDAALALWAPQLAELACSGSKQVRTAAEPLLLRAGPALVEALKPLALQAKPEVRLQALRVLASLAQQREDAGLLAFARETAAADKAAGVQALVAEWENQAQVPTEATYSYELPVIDWSATTNAVPADVLARLWTAINAAIDKSNALNREHHARGLAQGHKWHLHLDENLGAAQLARLKQELDSDGPMPGPQTRTAIPSNLQRLTAPALIKLAQEGQLTPVALVKMLRWFGFTDSDDAHLGYILVDCVQALHGSTGRPGLLELSLVLEAHGIIPWKLVRSYCARWGRTLANDWPDADVWPFIAHQQDLIIRMLGESTVNDWFFSRASLFKAIATLPSPPPALVNSLFELALGSAKGDRALAQEALKNLAGKEARIIAALENGKAEVRTVAAQWLGRLRFEPAVPALEQAVRKEKQDVAKGAMLDALQALGRPVEHYLDRGALDKDAVKALAKGLPKELENFPFAALPVVHWADTQAPVPRETLQWLVVQAFKQKNPEPNAVLRKLCGLMLPREREAFGQFVLEAWMAEDLRPHPHDEALRLARETARGQWHAMQNYAQYYSEAMRNMSEEERVAYYLPAFLRQPAGSAIGSKGLLAVAAACCAERAAPPVQRYLKDWYGTRAGQGKALIAMLAWIEHPSATQLMLSIGSRFRTKSFQEEATRQAEALAERKGWSLAELADRTIPSAGFDETGTLVLSYGPRSFTAKLLPDFKLELLNPEGKKIAALPEPRQDDDEAQAKDAKKAFSAAKKEIKSIVALQTDRLYEALCTARDWPVADWNDYLLQHPVLRHLVQRLVWLETLPDGAVRAFRPLDDGSLTDVNDDPVELAAEARVRLAHDSLLSADLVGAWQRHLADYAVKPLFQQFGKGSYTLPAGKADATEVEDFKGHLLEAFALRGRATKLGYTRGSTEDGGWFYTYEKRFPTLGLQAVIAFSGNGLPEENRTVALHHLSFAATGEGDRWSRAAQPLNKVPQVLLSECYDDLRLLAAEGTGFDPEWEKKSGN